MFGSQSNSLDNVTTLVVITVILGWSLETLVRGLF